MSSHDLPQQAPEKPLRSSASRRARETHTAFALPSYSLVIETENLSLANSECLWRCLASVERALRKMSKEPQEALLLNSGDIDHDALVTLAEKHAWLTPVTLSAGAGYYESKMIGARQTAAEIVVLVDSDCCYNEGWLHGLLSPFSDPEVNIVAGETGFALNGPYVLALSIIHSFDGFSGASTMYRANGYYANNVAMRRQLIVGLPISIDLPLYRHACAWHAVLLRRSGETIWSQPGSRAIHAPPEGLSHFFWRFLLFGRDRAVRARLGLVNDVPREEGQPAGAVAVALRRLTRVLHQKPSQLLWLPVSIPIIAVAYVLIRLGQLLSNRRPELAIDHFATAEDVRYPTVAEYLSR